MDSLILARKKYTAHKASAKQCGIAFLLTFEQWWKIWQTSGHWDDRNKGYMMTRPKHADPYAVGNAKIATAKQCYENRKYELLTTRLPKGTLERIETALEGREKQADFARTAIAAELARRERRGSAAKAGGMPARPE
jgi:hypothetical protein